MTLKDCLKTKADIVANCHVIENNIIRGADIVVLGHFGNCVSMNVWTDNCCVFTDYDLMGNLGFIIRAFVELFDLTEEDGLHFNKVKDIPCRIILEREGWGAKVIGFGHFMKDKFVYSKDFAKINEIEGVIK